MNSTKVKPERIRAQLDRILASAAFAGAERASNFLRFVVERAVYGHTGEIKESVIAVEVFGRDPSSFDSKIDPIVRVEAGRLRDRLDSYYQGDGKLDRVLIAIPKGGYVPEFSERQPSTSQKAGHQALVFSVGIMTGFAVAAIVLLHFHRPPKSGQTLQLSVLPPAGARFRSFAISSDGRNLAFVAAVNGTDMLWVRALDSLQAKPLAGTENASQPFWSPDGRSLGFESESTAKLKTVEIAGGPARDIADAIVGCGASWSHKGIIVFCPRPLSPLYEIPASGGTPKPITLLDSTRAEVAHAFPQFLPDGDHFLYLAKSARSGKSAIRLASLESTGSKVLLAADTSSAYAPVLPGHPPSLLFVYDGALMAQPFDSRRLRSSGDPTVLLQKIRYRPWHQARFSVSNNGVLVYQESRAENQQLTWLDRRGHLLSEVGPRNNYEAFSLSPDEKHVAIYRDDDPATPFPTIWVMDLSHGGGVSRFIDSSVAEATFAPVWSPDSRQILYSRGDDRRMRLLCQPLDGGPATLVLDSPGPKFPTDWSSDGRFITYGSQWPDYQYLHTWTVTLTATGRQGMPRTFLRHQFEDFGAHFSPARGSEAPQWIAYTSRETGREEVYVRDFPAGTRKWQISTHGGLLPEWRGDGKELFFLSPEGTMMAVAVKLGIDFNFGNPKALFETGFRPTFPVLTMMNQYGASHDGQRFLFNRMIPDPTFGAITVITPR